MLIREIMHPNPIVVQPDTTLCAAYALMQEKGIRHLPVVLNNRLTGIITDRDLRLATSRLAEHPFEPDAAVKDVMNTRVQTTHPNDPVEQSTRLMRSLKIGCLPVLENSKLVGIVTSADLLDALLRLIDQRFLSYEHH
jgi:acetoin utilization protein AcuB